MRINIKIIDDTWSATLYNDEQLTGYSLGILLQPFQSHGLWAFDGQAHQSRPHEVRRATERSGHGKNNSVVIFLTEAIVLHAGARQGIHVRPWVLHLASRLQDWRDSLVGSLSELDQWI